jgi:hypothetical protein
MINARKHNNPKARNCPRFLRFILDTIAIVGKNIKKMSCGYTGMLTGT